MSTLSLLASFQRRFSEALHCSDELFRESKPIAKGMEVYRTGYRIRIECSLEEDFPILVEVLGDERFSELVERFLVERGSVYASLSELGKSFVPYVAESALITEFPYLADLARYEWLKILSMLSNEDESANFSAAPGAESAVQINRSAFLWQGNWPIHLLEDDVSAKLGATSTSVLIWERSGDIQTRILNSSEAGLFEKMKTGCSIKELGEIAQALGMGEAALTKLFSQWVADGVIIGWGSP